MNWSSWDPAYEAYLLNHWYTLNRIIFTLTPPVYLYLSCNCSKIPRLLRGYRIALPLITAFTCVCLFTEAYNLARPIYVCFDPVRGETPHTLEEARLKIQWMLYAMAGIMALAVVAVRLRDKVRESRGYMRMDIIDFPNNRAVIGIKFEEVESKEKEKINGDKRLGRARGWRRSCYAGEMLIMAAWVEGMYAYFIMEGRSKRPAFGF